MKRNWMRILELLLLAALMTACQRRNPVAVVPTVSPLSFYYPLEAGNWWVTSQIYWESSDTVRVDTVRTEVVLAIVVPGDGVHYCCSHEPRGDTLWIAVSEDEIRVYSDEPSDTGACEIILSLPLGVGDEWTLGWVGSERMLAEVTSKREEISVPAGIFSTCLQVEVRDDDDRLRWTSWYAPNVGLVRSCSGSADSGWDIALLDYEVVQVNPLPR